MVITREAKLRTLKSTEKFEKKFLTKQERCGNISKLPKGGGRTALRMREQKSLKKLEKSS